MPEIGRIAGRAKAPRAGATAAARLCVSATRLEAAGRVCATRAVAATRMPIARLMTHE